MPFRYPSQLLGAYLRANTRIVYSHWQTAFHGARSSDKPAKISDSKAVPGDGGSAAGRNRSRFDEGGIRSRQHQPDRRDRRRERRLALPVFSQQGGARGGTGPPPPFQAAQTRWRTRG